MLNRKTITCNTAGQLEQSHQSVGYLHSISLGSTFGNMIIYEAVSLSLFHFFITTWLPQVLSVVATQVKTIQDCIKKFAVVSNRDPEYQHLPPGLPPVKLGNFIFEGDMISLTPTCGFYITMNPGYAGRTELPENLKVLFRSCAMIRPDLKLICENMLMSEGFQGARVLAIKFVTLYELSSELLSKQAHYDW